MNGNTREPRPRGIGWKSTWWLLALIGGVATFLGLFILFGNEDEYVGLGGDWAWQVGEIGSVLALSILIGGLMALAIVVRMTIQGRRMGPVTTTPVQDLMFHAGVFAVVNAYIWVQDYALGTGLDYAHWVTIPWGIGLAVHAFTTFTAKSPAPTEQRAERERQLH